MKKALLAASLVILLLATASFFLVTYENSSTQDGVVTVENRVVLITIDTTRYDHLGCFGYERDTSPNIDRLASSGVKFTNCYTSMPTTDPSHVSILTSSYPRTHGVLKNGMEISNPTILSIAEWFKEKGYATAAITARAHLNPTSLRLKGFDYVNAPKEDNRDAKEVCKKAVRFIKKHSKTSFFLWVHFFDPHTPYDPPPPYDSRFGSGFKGLLKKEFTFLPKGVRWTDDEIAHNISLHDGEIRYMDYHIGNLLRFLQEGFPENSVQPLIIVVADHGETFGELQGSFAFVFGHGKFLYNCDIKIPLIMSWKGKLPEGKTVGSLIESIDIAPTITDLICQEKPPQFSGISFKDSILGNAVEHKRYAFIQRRIFSQPPKAYLAGEEFAVVTQGHKLIDNPARGTELYDLIDDKRERINLAAQKADVVKKLREKLAKWQEAYPPLEAVQVLSEEKKDALKALGYLP